MTETRQAYLCLALGMAAIADGAPMVGWVLTMYACWLAWFKGALDRQGAPKTDSATGEAREATKPPRVPD